MEKEKSKYSLSEKLDTAQKIMAKMVRLDDQIDFQINQFNERYRANDGFKYIDKRDIKDVGYTYYGAILEIQKQLKRVLANINDADKNK